MHDANIIGSSFAEKAKIKFFEFAQNFKRDLNRFANHIRLNHYFNKLISNNQNFHNLWVIIKTTLSHGSADVESGFSINKNLVIENMLEQSIVSQ